MNKFLLFVIALLALLAMPVIAHQAPPCIGFGLAVESLAVAIETDCLDLKTEQSTLEKAFLDSNTRLSETLMRWTFYNSENCELIGDNMAVQGIWLDNIGYCWQAS